MSSSQNSSSSSERDVTPSHVFQQLLDVQVPADVLLGTGSVTVRQCLALDRNSLLELRQSAGEDLLLDIRGVNIARGEIVIVEDSAALRITEISAPPPPKAVE
jgi:flagellar motor switch protein FliN/FliY